MKSCRFAPSPTGFLHVGNIRAAIINFLYARKIGGKFILRLDDTDVERVCDEYRDQILRDMQWLGLRYDDLIKQSNRLEKYEEAKNRLIANGRLYECFETPEELNLQRKSQIASGLTPIYNRSATKLTKEQKNSLRAQGLKPHYRFLLEDKKIEWNDKIKGRIFYDGLHFSDPVLVRDNGVPTYTFCSVIDDIDYKITDIIRGEDHITNTAIQIQIFEALDAAIPDFAHLALVKASHGKISKREGGFDIKALKNEGYEPMSIINLLAQIGTSDALKIYKNFDELVANFSFEKFSKSATNYDIGELTNINQKLLQSLDFKEVEMVLEEIGITEKISPKFWNIVKSNLCFLHEIKDWIEICSNKFRFSNKKEDQEFLLQAASLLPSDTEDENCWNLWFAEIKKHSPRKGKELFMPIRLALTGKEHGPEMRFLVNLITKDEILKRLTRF
ncbi:MAG: glutamate--tRNA ligase [Alphaproteobacteria bacterium RIFCSPLOWO2_01_FULL_40_26]|nr:MAG: glutamate--tRNA ligase [Alphaproteobacteria bacterium RIFCSPHIGHO2_02_FULL_40_34]OFW86288.1 MAG: glutamate--tRNA ligase [Alphaproteobacteria bacterium RIFCSPHIGHO2_01_FULL_40_8]OFW94993.1 MAG: glutamate--tRNA ligase [Alphaproteobacteria bacterium RIFCSPLOWO2_01_FULL_40_26]OFX10559.1 MAG: glutamate--tRNA ligase [Alphaproteobacteria bacterium RIFCSPLOWO2_02_FULL_40_19]OFX12076.1 MAG: glutamate--tRNA ligase [Alphaproteobacteria bacterium RIFCSPLOWO2_12_FULL_40_11]